MKTAFFLTSAVFLLAFTFNASGQGAVAAPPGASDRNMSDRAIKDRSIEMERMKREAQMESDPPAKGRELNFAQIKEDFEQIQVSFDEGVVKTYKMTDPINYRSIASHSNDITERAIRLRGNLFPARDKKKDKKNEASTGAAQSSDVRTLIVQLNDSLAAFVSSPIFKNTHVIDPAESEKARLELEKIIEQSMQLSEQAGIK